MALDQVPSQEGQGLKVTTTRWIKHEFKRCQPFAWHGGDSAEGVSASIYWENVQLRRRPAETGSDTTQGVLPSLIEANGQKQEDTLSRLTSACGFGGMMMVGLVCLRDAVRTVLAARGVTWVGGGARFQADPGDVLFPKVFAMPGGSSSPPTASRLGFVKGSLGAKGRVDMFDWQTGLDLQGTCNMVP